jgi:hypothetical protein
MPYWVVINLAVYFHTTNYLRTRIYFKSISCRAGDVMNQHFPREKLKVKKFPACYKTRTLIFCSKRADITQILSTSQSRSFHNLFIYFLKLDITLCFYINCGPGSVVGIAPGYGLDGPGIESRWGARFSAPVQTGPGENPASCTMDTGSFRGVKSGRDVTLTPHPPSSAVVKKE